MSILIIFVLIMYILYLHNLLRKANSFSEMFIDGVVTVIEAHLQSFPMLFTKEYFDENPRIKTALDEFNDAVIVVHTGSLIKTYGRAAAEKSPLNKSLHIYDDKIEDLEATQLVNSLSDEDLSVAAFKLGASTKEGLTIDETRDLAKQYYKRILKERR